MPAVLVEVGPITNPTAESSILSDQGLNRLVQAIGKGISTYLDQ
jgi:N-acetylmuramoyl-L-alanine amidase